MILHLKNYRSPYSKTAQRHYRYLDAQINTSEGNSSICKLLIHPFLLFCRLAKFNLPVANFLLCWDNWRTAPVMSAAPLISAGPGCLTLGRKSLYIPAHKHAISPLPHPLRSTEGPRGRIEMARSCITCGKRRTLLPRGGCLFPKGTTVGVTWSPIYTQCFTSGECKTCICIINVCKSPVLSMQLDVSLKAFPFWKKTLSSIICEPGCQISWQVLKAFSQRPSQWFTYKLCVVSMVSLPFPNYWTQLWFPVTKTPTSCHLPPQLWSPPLNK